GQEGVECASRPFQWDKPDSLACESELETFQEDFLPALAVMSRHVWKTAETDMIRFVLTSSRHSYATLLDEFMLHQWSFGVLLKVIATWMKRATESKVRCVFRCLREAFEDCQKSAEPQPSEAAIEGDATDADKKALCL
ncbi:hypothetical protein BaRGS_00028778, partial [Batillaria attramentaria]